MEYFAKLKHLAVFAWAAVVLCGCDWVKGQLGMPTSEDIAMMRDELQQRQILQEQEAREREKEKADSLAQVAAKLPKIEGYHVIIGSFKDYSNAGTLEKFVETMGYRPQQIPLKNGYMMVSAGGYATLDEAVRQMRRMEGEEVCPYDVWIYGANQNLHVEN